MDWLIARSFCTSVELRKSASSIAASGSGEYLDTATFQPPRVAAERASGPSPLGSGATSNRPFTAESSPLPSE
ncbi:hypothetical protein D3C72_2221560 [compost metagenome]